MTLLLNFVFISELLKFSVGALNVKVSLIEWFTPIRSELGQPFLQGLFLG